MFMTTDPFSNMQCKVQKSTTTKKNKVFITNQIQEIEPRLCFAILVLVRRAEALAALMCPFN